jgi:hypothetical protein
VLITKNEILTGLWQSQFIKDLLQTITSGHQLKEDLRQELFLILLEMDEKKIIRAHKGNWLHYLCVNIVKKQYHSNTSPFHKMFRKECATDVEVPLQNVDDAFWSEANDEIIEKVVWFIENKLDLVDRELFKIYYKIGRYDRWVGDLRDATCQKATSSLRKVEKKLAITTLDGKQISIGYDTIRLSLNRSLMRIKHYLKDVEYNN